VVDFIDYRAGWVESMNQLITKLVSTWHVTDHWPTFNVADICICVGVGLMALDMLGSGRRNREGSQEGGRPSSSSPHPVQ
jgi:signal peptidase II